ncbi:MAG: TRAP transporter small permease [Bacillota bacterium]|jgi:C4-dicarboxylate transporter DctQ subunit
MNRLIGFYNKLEEYLLVGSLAITVIILFFQVVLRYVFNSSLSWSEELARYIFVWQSWLGASLGLRERRHIKVEILTGALKGRAKTLVEIIGVIIWLGLCVFLVSSGTEMAMSYAKQNAVTPALRIPFSIIYATLPISCGLIVLRLIGQVFEMFKELFYGERGAA